MTQHNEQGLPKGGSLGSGLPRLHNWRERIERKGSSPILDPGACQGSGVNKRNQKTKCGQVDTKERETQLDMVSQKPGEQCVFERECACVMSTQDKLLGCSLWLITSSFMGVPLDLERMHVFHLGACTNKEEQALLL